jgi:hypothetical protein
MAGLSSEMGTAIYKLSGKINFQVKKTRRPGRFPSLRGGESEGTGCWEESLPFGSIVCAFYVAESPSWLSDWDECFIHACYLNFLSSEFIYKPFPKKLYFL